MINVTKTSNSRLYSYCTAGLQPGLAAKPVGITKEMMSVETNHLGKAVKIQRNQDNAAIISKFYRENHRVPVHHSVYCLCHWIQLLKTIGELELLQPCES